MRDAPDHSSSRLDWRMMMAAAVALVVLAVMTTQTMFTVVPATNQPYWPSFRAQLVNWGVWLPILPVIMHIARRSHERRLPLLVMIVVQLVVAGGIALLHGGLLGLVRWATGMAPPTNSLQRVVALQVTFNLNNDFIRYWLFAAPCHAWIYFHQVRERDARAARLAASLAEARLSALESRLHPHFLFNTLNALTALIRKDPPAAIAMVGQLGDLLRAALDAAPGQEVSLARELELLDRYAAIQQARFSDRLTVNVRAAPDTLDARVPQLILQPIVENAIRHGIAPREAPGEVTVTAQRHNGRLTLVVRDDGVGFSTDASHDHGGGIGIPNTRARLATLYGAAGLLTVTPATPTGTVVTIEMPYRADSLTASRDG